MSRVVIEAELAEDLPDADGEPWHRRLFVDRVQSDGQAYLTIHDDGSDDETAVLIDPARAREIAARLVAWADEQEVPQAQIVDLGAALMRSVKDGAK